MNLGRCPTCHSHIQLEAIIQDDAMSQLIKLIAKMDMELSVPLIIYIGLFRSAKRDLAGTKALKLCKEVMELSQDIPRLITALSQTVEMIRSKNGGQLKNHNYLKRVLENIEPSQNMPTMHKKQTGMSKTEQGLVSIEDVKNKYA